MPSHRTTSCPYALTYTLTHDALRNLLEDVLTEARVDFVERRASGFTRRGRTAKAADWQRVAQDTVRVALERLWFEASRPREGDIHEGI